MPLHRVMNPMNYTAAAPLSLDTCGTSSIYFKVLMYFETSNITNQNLVRS